MSPFYRDAATGKTMKLEGDADSAPHRGQSVCCNCSHWLKSPKSTRIGLCGKELPNRALRNRWTTCTSWKAVPPHNQAAR